MPSFPAFASPASPADASPDETREAARRAALHATGLLDAPPPEPLQAIVAAMAAALAVPVAVLSLVDAHRQFFVAAVGLDEPWATCRQTPLSHSICRLVVATGEPLVIEDARTAPALIGNGAVPDLGVGAYLGAPLVTSTGHALGSCCVFQARPRAWTDAELATVSEFAAAAMRIIDRRPRDLVR